VGLRELSVVEQRFHAVMEVLSGSPKSEVALRYGASRQTVHTWTVRYQQGGLRGLEDRSHRPASFPNRVDPGVEALVCTLRKDHLRWGLRRLRHELGKRGVIPVPGRATLYRILVRNNLLIPVSRKRRRQDSCGGSARSQWSYGNSTLSAVSCWPMEPRRRSSPASTTTPGSASSRTWCVAPPAGLAGCPRPGAVERLAVRVRGGRSCRPHA
jgi:transposase